MKSPPAMVRGPRPLGDLRTFDDLLCSGVPSGHVARTLPTLGRHATFVERPFGLAGSQDRPGWVSLASDRTHGSGQRVDQNECLVAGRPSRQEQPSCRSSVFRSPSLPVALVDPVDSSRVNDAPYISRRSVSSSPSTPRRSPRLHGVPIVASLSSVTDSSCSSGDNININPSSPKRASATRGARSVTPKRRRHRSVAPARVIRNSTQSKQGSWIRHEPTYTEKRRHCRFMHVDGRCTYLTNMMCSACGEFFCRNTTTGRNCFSQHVSWCAGSGLPYCTSNLSMTWAT